MKDGNKVRIVKPMLLYGMSLMGRTGRVKDIGSEWATVEVVNVKWLVRVPKAALQVED